MTPDTFVLTVVGVPAPQGSKTHVGRGRMVESSKRVKPWRDAVHTACATRGWGPRRRFVGPVAVEVVFAFERPASHYRAGRIVKSTAPGYPTARWVGDLDKLIRSTLDGLTVQPDGFGAIADDCLVVDVQASKRWASDGASPGAVIIIRPT